MKKVIALAGMLAFFGCSSGYSSGYWIYDERDFFNQRTLNEMFTAVAEYPCETVGVAMLVGLITGVVTKYIMDKVYPPRKEAQYYQNTVYAAILGTIVSIGVAANRCWYYCSVNLDEHTGH
ncbi:MAG: hypothetical protein LBF84_04170 [Holosporales bacterium]|nr:hypothetical protein [Holosporales bacterium]